jgi:4'-phosphopantetheinyl transferase EntD
MISLLIDTPYGRCAIGEGEGELLDEELAHAAKLAETRRKEFAAGRTALRRAFGQNVAILPDDRGAPQLPTGWVGSISHKGLRAAAIVAPAETGFVGIDLELATPSKLPIERRILTPREQERVSGREVTLYFAIKEAIYKAVDPIVRRYVGFTEVELTIVGNTAAVHVLDPARLPVEVEAWWQEREGHWLATARARPVLTLPRWT